MMHAEVFSSVAGYMGLLGEMLNFVGAAGEILRHRNSGRAREQIKNLVSFANEKEIPLRISGIRLNDPSADALLLLKNEAIFTQKSLWYLVSGFSCLIGSRLIELAMHAKNH